MITVGWEGQFGNQLFEYCFGRLLAEHWGLAMRCPPHFTSKRKKKKNHAIWNELFIPQQVKGKVIEGSVSPFVYCDQYGPGYAAKVWAVFDSKPRRCTIGGYWQLSEVYEPHRKKIRTEWFPLPLEPVERIAIHIRLGDFPIHMRPTAADHIAAIKQLPKDLAILVVSNEGEWHPDIEALFDEFGDRVSHNGCQHLKDFKAIANSSHVVLNLQSTFPWWAAFMGDPKQVVAIDTGLQPCRDKYLKMTFTDFIVQAAKG